jgi:hypothetical protein
MNRFTHELRMARRPITFVTSNPRKLEEFVAILGSSFPCLVTSSSVDLPELQGEPEVVAAEKCKLAASVVGGPVGECLRCVVGGAHQLTVRCGVWT